MTMPDNTTYIEYLKIAVSILVPVSVALMTFALNKRSSIKTKTLLYTIHSRPMVTFDQGLSDYTLIERNQLENALKDFSLQYRSPVRFREIDAEVFNMGDESISKPNILVTGVGNVVAFATLPAKMPGFSVDTETEGSTLSAVPQFINKGESFKIKILTYDSTSPDVRIIGENIDRVIDPIEADRINYNRKDLYQFIFAMSAYYCLISAGFDVYSLFNQSITSFKITLYKLGAFIFLFTVIGRLIYEYIGKAQNKQLPYVDKYYKG